MLKKEYLNRINYINTKILSSLQQYEQPFQLKKDKVLYKKNLTKIFNLQRTK